MASKNWIASKLIWHFPDWALRLKPSLSISIEASCACNIRCLCCPIGNKHVEGHNMEMEDFEKILDLLPPYLRRLDFSHRGDPTMNPRFVDMVRLAHQKGFHTDIYTNGLILDQYIPDLVESGLDIIRIDCDGATEQSYLNYRIGSDYEKVKSNIRSLVESRAHSQGKFPKRIYMICVVSAFNENEIPQIQDLAKQLGVDKLLFKSAIINYGTKYYHDEAKQDSIAPQNPEFRRGQRPEEFICPFLRRGAILYNGDLQICTADFEGKYILGNILKENSFEKVYFSRKANAIRKKIVNQTGEICKTCCVVGEGHYIESISRDFSQ